MSKMADKELLYERPTNVSDPTSFFFDFIGGITDGLWPVALSFMTFSIVYLSLNEYNPRKAYGAASFTTFVVVSMLVALGAFETSALVIAILMVVFALVLNNGEGGRI